MQINFSAWGTGGQCGLTEQEMLQLIEACRLAHQNVLNIGTACGIRAGFRLLADAAVLHDGAHVRL